MRLQANYRLWGVVLIPLTVDPGAGGFVLLRYEFRSHSCYAVKGFTIIDVPSPTAGDAILFAATHFSGCSLACHRKPLYARLSRRASKRVPAAHLNSYLDIRAGSDNTNNEHKANNKTPDQQWIGNRCIR